MKLGFIIPILSSPQVVVWSFLTSRFNLDNYSIPTLILAHHMGRRPMWCGELRCVELEDNNPKVFNLWSYHFPSNYLHQRLVLSSPLSLPSRPRRQRLAGKIIWIWHAVPYSNGSLLGVELIAQRSCAISSTQLRCVSYGTSYVLKCWSLEGDGF